MCSVSGDIEELNSSNCMNLEQFQEVKKTNCNTCRKCGESSVVLLQKKDPYCKTCFLTYCHHKFRATIGKSKKIKPDHKILITCSCGSKSSAMLDMVIQTLKDSFHKKLSFQIGVLFIDESSIVTCCPKEIKKTMTDIIEKTSSHKCSILYSAIEMVFRSSSSDDAFYWEFTDKVQCNVSNSAKTQLLNSLSSMKSLTSKLDFIACLKRQLILDIASAEKYTHIFMGDSATDLAIKFLSDIAVGRGSQVSHNTAFYDTQYKVPICRPMREFLNKEIAFYNQLTEVCYVNQPTLLTMADSFSSIQRLTETFVNGLQNNFPATVFTIFRTGGKISTNVHQSKDNICVMCKSFKDNVQSVPCSAVESLYLSAMLSKPLEESSTNEDKELDRLKEVLCHGCLIIMKELGSCAFLPPHMLEETSTRISRSDMKDTIKEYLLNDDND